VGRNGKCVADESDECEVRDNCWNWSSIHDWRLMLQQITTYFLERYETAAVVVDFGEDLLEYVTE
jgi:hypothetical protein